MTDYDPDEKQEPYEADRAFSEDILHEAMRYPKKPYSRVLFPNEDGTWGAHIAEFPGCLATGETAAQAFANLEDTAVDWLCIVLDKGQDVPVPSDPVQAAKRVGDEATAKPRIRDLDISDARVIRRAEESHEFAVEWIKAQLEDDQSTVAILRQERDRLERERDAAQKRSEYHMILSDERGMALAEISEMLDEATPNEYDDLAVAMRDRARTALSEGDGE